MALGLLELAVGWPVVRMTTAITALEVFGLLGAGPQFLDSRVWQLESLCFIVGRFYSLRDVQCFMVGQLSFQ